MSVSVTLDNVTLSYNRHAVVHHVSGCFKAGSLTAIAGPNGAGKSTLIKAIAGILPPESGHITLSDKGGKNLAYLPQASEMQRDFPMSVLHMVCTGFWHKTGSLCPITSDMRERAAQALTTVGLKDFGKRDLLSLSTGQFQRALFARLLVQDAPLMLLDEPFASVDESTTLHLLSLIQRWHKEGRTIICVLHDFEQIRNYFPECLLLARECIAWEASPKALHPEKLLGARFFREDWKQDPVVCERAV